MGAQDDGTYTCTATNAVQVPGSAGPGGQPAQARSFATTVDQQLRVKSRWAWLTPFCVILVTLIALAAVITFCECRKRKAAQSAAAGPTKPLEED